MDFILALVLLLAFLSVYFMPTLTAFFLYRSKKKYVVLFINTLLGWTLIGWFVAFLLAASKNKETNV